MEQSPDMNNSNSSVSQKPQQETNINTLYEYTNSLLETVSADIKSADSKLAAILASSGFLLKFTKELPGKFPPIDGNLECYSCMLLKVICCLAIMASVLCCISGFKAKNFEKSPLQEKENHRPAMGVADPARLIEKYCSSEPEHDLVTKKRIMKTNSLARQELIKKCNRKNRDFNNASICLAIAATCFGIDILIDICLRGT